ncbi:MAG: amidohydrolase family protein [Alphaproteobacteria bacterium]|nr:amidohydrolase family protein [Alphaproteobacteria bacterium]
MLRFRAAMMAAMVVFFVGSAAAAPVPEKLLAKPAFDAETWVIVSPGGQHGQSKRWVEKDGTRWSRESMNLRGFKTEIDQRIVFAPDGTIAALEVRGSVPQGDAAESFQVAKGRFDFKSPVDRGAGPSRFNLYYAPFGGTLDATIALIDALRRTPDGSLDLLPSGRLSLETLTTSEVSNGRVTRKLTAYAVTGFGFSPQPIWYDGDQFFGIVDVVSYVPERWTNAVAALSKAQDEAMAARAPGVLARLAPKATGAIAFKDVRLYDADAKTFRQGMTVIAVDGRIAAVGPAASTDVPTGAQVIDGHGKTLVPGLWDNHQHFGDDSSGPLLLAQGITSIRDPGNRPEELMARKKRIEEGQLLGPRIVPSLMIDGPGKMTAQAAVVVKTEEEAIAAVARAKREGYFGIKLYGSLNPAFVKPMADEAHRLGLRVHGHIPAGMRPLEAVRAGYDEITHINFVLMQAMPDDVIKQSNGEMRLFGPGRYGAAVDLKSPAMRAYLDELTKRGTAIDPTLPVIETVLLGERGRLSNAYAPFAGTLPPQVERGFKAGGLSPPADLARATLLKSFAKLQALVLDLSKRGVPVLAGTDGTGLELVRELELYVAAGMKPVEALACATIVPAKAFGLDGETGSLAVGKQAELALIDGDPSKRIGDLRQVELVMRDGRLMKAEDLRTAVGITGAPKRGK